MTGDGGGFFNASGAHPYENPSAWSDTLEILLMLFMIVFVAVFLGGLMVGRTPEFLRKRIGFAEMRYVVLYALAARSSWSSPRSRSDCPQAGRPCRHRPARTHRGPVRLHQQRQQQRQRHMPAMARTRGVVTRRPSPSPPARTR
jgi:Potassium-transporting ATPase A subunit